MNRLVATLVVLVPALVQADTPKPATPTKTEPAKAPAAGAPVMPPMPPKAPPTPAPSAEFNEYAGGVVGTWKCKGKVTTPAGEVDATATYVNKLDLDKWWVQTTFTAKIGKESYKFSGYTGFNTAEQKFYRVTFDNKGAAEWNTAAAIDHGMADKWGVHWEGEVRAANNATGMTTNTMKTRYMDAYTKAGVEMTGEMSPDGGKTWKPQFTATCKK